MDTINEENKWKVLHSEYLFKRPWLTARKDEVQLPDGRINPEYYILEYADWVNVIAITKMGEFVLERQYRHGLGKTCYELPCGVIEEGETPLEAAKRELKEETGLSLAIKEFKEVGTYSDIDRDPRERVITVAHYALVKLADVQADTDADKAEWFSLPDVPSLAFDHDKILRDAFSRLKQDIHFQPVGFELLPEVFTLPQLQNLYESILEVKFDRRNFAYKMKHFGILSEMDDGTRAPVRYRFEKENYDRLKSNSSDRSTSQASLLL